MCFVTDEGIEVTPVTAAQMAQVDRVATSETGPHLLQMMENAGRNLAELTLERFAKPPGALHVVVLAGRGGNGGGGICAARHLANHGVNVSLFLAEPDRLGDAPAWQRRIFASTPGRELSLSRLLACNAEVVLDALLGYSLNGAPDGVYREAICWANASPARVIALDIPSGVEATTGETPGVAASADLTMTLALPFTGLTPENGGELVLADIGIPLATFRKLEIAYRAPFGRRYRVPITRIDA